MKKLQIIRQVVDIIVEFLGLSHSVALSRRLFSPKKRLLRMERLENRHVLSASGLVDDGAIVPEDAEVTTSTSASSEIVAEVAPAPAASDVIHYELASNASVAPSSDDAELSELADAEIEWDGAENVDESELSESELETQIATLSPRNSV